MNWKNRVKIKHLFTKQEDHAAVQESMNKVADELEKHPFFRGFSLLKKFRDIPEGDEVVPAVEYANTLLSKMYDYADRERIWIE